MFFISQVGRELMVCIRLHTFTWTILSFNFQALPFLPTCIYTRRELLCFNEHPQWIFLFDFLCLDLDKMRSHLKDLHNTAAGDQTTIDQIIEIFATKPGNPIHLLFALFVLFSFLFPFF